MDTHPIISIRESCEHVAGIDNGDLREYVTEIHLEILGGEDDETVVGTGRVYDIAGIWYGQDMREEDITHNLLTLDAESGELEALHYAVMDWYKQTSDEWVRNILHIQDIQITHQEQADGILAVVLEHLLDYWSLQRSSSTVVTFWAVPLRKDTDSEEWSRVDPGGFQEAQLKLVQAYERHGFRLAPDSDFMVSHLAFQRDRMPGQRAIP